MNNLKPKARRSVHRSDASGPQPAAQPSRGAQRHSERRQSKGTCQQPGHNREPRSPSSEKASKATTGSKRKAPTRHEQLPADSGQPVGPNWQSKRLRGRDAAAAAAAAMPAKPAAPRQVAVLGRSRTTGRRPVDSVTWDGETYAVRIHSPALPACHPNSCSMQHIQPSWSRSNNPWQDSAAKSSGSHYHGRRSATMRMLSWT